MDNNLTNELVEQLTNGTAEVIEEKTIKRGLSTGNAFADAGILTAAVGGAAALGVLFGIKHERKKWEYYDEEMDDYDDEFDDEDFVEYEEAETEPTDTTKEAEKTDKPEEK